MLLVLASCGKGPPPGPSATASASAKAAPTASAQLSTDPRAAPPGVLLLRPGDAPRQRLRYRFVAGARTTWLLEARAHAMSGGEGEPLAIEATLDARVIDAAAATIEVAVRESGVASLAGRVGRLRVSPRGEVTSELTPTAPLDEATAQLWGTLAEAVGDAWVELPAEPVGRGAAWRIRRPRRRGGVGLTRTSKATLKEGGEVARVALVVDERADPTFEGRAPGLALVALAGRGEGTHELAWAANAAFVTASESTVITSLKVRARVTTPGAAGAPVVQEVSTAQVFTLVSKAALDRADDARQNVPDGG